MNKKLKIALIRCSSEQGFAIPIAVGLGFVMLLIGSMMIMRSQGDQVTASAQKGTAQSLAVAEGGISRTLSQLNQSNPNFSSLLKLTYDPNGLLGSALNEWTSANMPPCATVSPILSGTIGNSTYQVLAYRYDASTKRGTFLVEGLVPTGTSSRSRIQQTFNVDPKPASLVGVLGTTKISLGNNDITGIYGNVACGNTGTGNCAVSCPYTYTTASARNAIGAGPQANISGKIFLGPVKTPVLPTMPPEWNGSGTPPTTEFTIPLGDYKTNNTTLTFPRAGDFNTHIAGTPYNYSIGTMDANGFNITINTQTDTLKNPTGDPVYFWVSGQINMGGSSKLNHTASSTYPTDFRIYGTATTSQDFLVASGASSVDAFIFAPHARVGINGTGTINGIVYAQSFGEIGANGNAAVNIPTNSNLATSLGDLAIYFSQQIGSTTSWQKQAVP